MKNCIKKILLVCILTVSLLLTSCFSEESTIGWAEFPDSIYTAGFSMNEFKEKVKVTIDGKEYSLNNLPEGVQVAGLNNTVGNYTLYVTYNGSSIMFAYNVIASGEVIEDFDISWYNNFDTEFEICKAELQNDDKVNQLRGLAYLVNVNHYTFYGKTIKLGSNVDLTGITWTPIGEGSRKYVNGLDTPYFMFSSKSGESMNCYDGSGYFAGTFDGNNKVIKGLTNEGYILANSVSYQTSSKIAVAGGYTFGLFGRVVGATIKNLTMTEVKIDTAPQIVIIDGEKKTISGDSVACVAGYVGGGKDRTTEFTNIHVSGSVEALDCAAGIAGKSYGYAKFTDCINECDVTSVLDKSSKACGITAYANSGVEFINCVNKGIIRGSYNPRAIVWAAGSKEFNGCINEGKIYEVINNKDNEITGANALYL